MEIQAEKKIFLQGRTRIHYDPNRLGIAFDTEFLTSSTGQPGICIYLGSARYIKDNSPISTDVLEVVKSDLVQEFFKEGMYVNFNESSF